MAGNEVRSKRLPAGVREGKDGRFYWEIDRKRDDGSRFRKAGSSKSASVAGAKYKSALREFESNLNSSLAVTFREWAEYCIGSIFPVTKSRLGNGYAPTTFAEYERQLYSNLIPTIGDILLEKLTPEHIDAALQRLKGHENRVKARNVGSRVFALAEQRQKVQRGSNPFRMVVLAPKRKARHADGSEVQTIRVLTMAEEDLILATSKDHPVYGWVYGVILLGLRLGLRKGEILGLDWRHIDFESKCVRIVQQRQRISKKTRERLSIESNGGFIVVEPKTNAGFRTLPLPKSCLDWLVEQKAKSTSPHVISNVFGNAPREPKKVDNAFRKIVEECHLHRSTDIHGSPKAIPTPHDLRHTFCSRMANDFNVPAQVLAALAGHSDVKITLGYYVHASFEGMERAMSNMP